MNEINETYSVEDLKRWRFEAKRRKWLTVIGGLAFLTLIVWLVFLMLDTAFKLLIMQNC